MVSCGDLKFAAIDIGSNAMRVLFQQVFETPEGPIFKKLSLIRLPVRLGEDAFLTGEISKKKEDHLVHLAHAFNHLCSIFEVEDYKATATSAMRDSRNGREIIDRIKSETGIEIEIIPGDEEAELLYEGIFNTGKINDESTYMFIDVGGGSTEINFYVRGERASWRSFNVGTVRQKEGLVDAKALEDFYEWIATNAAKHKPKYAVGTGGNINKLYKLCGLKDWEMLSLSSLNEKIDFLKQFSAEELVNKFDIKTDRADVIVPGGTIYVEAMRVAHVDEMIVPKVGLPDGLIRRIYLAGKEGK